MVVAVVFSLAVGSATLPWSTVRDALLHPGGGVDHLTVTALRLPRTVLGVVAGAALATAGALIQALTRNDLADPGILGVNAGAGFAVVLAVAVLGVTRIQDYLAFAFLGAVLAAALVWAIATRGAGGASPVRLVLVGVALGAVLTGAANSLALIDPQTFDRMRYWGAGTLADRPAGTVTVIAPFVLVGLVLALALAWQLNGLALGDDLARSIGVRLGVVRALGMIAITLLCGAATAAAGPIGFVGLMVPHAVRWFTGPDHRWVLPFSLVLGPVLVLTADIVGRVVVRPAELQVGVLTALIGAPVLIVLVRRRRATGL
nr:iron chelate uptake ABC transporter family permease subunit [Cellulomonas sp. RIT-PI-Y]